MNDTMNITPNQLRRLLYQLDDQKMTVEELRKRLFDIPSPKDDEPLMDDFQVWKRLGVEK